MKDPYKSLGVNKNSTEGEIKKAYRKLAKEYHPDKSSGNEEKFKEVADAYETLSDPKKKSQYDYGSANPFSGGGFNDAFFEDFKKMQAVVVLVVLQGGVGSIPKAAILLRRFMLI